MAATTLLKTLVDPGTPASVKVRAAEAIFNHAAKAIEIEDIEARSEIRSTIADTLKLGSAYDLERFRLAHDFSAEVHCGTEQSN